MGEVWLARQTAPIERQVALKLVQPALRDPVKEALFQIEQQALARLEHPAIARVYEAGRTESGAQYFAMEWVAGQRLDHYAEIQRLNLSQIYALLIQACRGIQHAHLKRILHRDLKPANILVRQDPGEEAQVKIIDFGIAGAPGTGQLKPIGTEGYMSPEQMVPGEVLDARCDVHALGVILLELAMQALDIPFSDWWWTDSTARFDSLRATPRRPHEHSLARLPAELRAVVVRAMHPDREQRYAGAEALANDLRALLEQRPVQALPPRRGYLLRKFVERHRVAVALSTLALLALWAALIAAWTGWQRAEAAHRETVRTADFLRSILAEVDPERSRGLDTTLLRQVLDAAAERSQAELGAVPAVRAAIDATIVNSLRGLGEYRRAAEQAARAHAAALAALGAETEATLALALEQARALNSAGDNKAARTLAEEHWPRAARQLGSNHPQTLGWAGLLVRMRRQQGEVAAAIGLGESVLATIDQPEDEAWIELGIETGIAMATDARFDPALALLQRAVDAYARGRGTDSFAVMKSRGELAVVLFMAKRYAQARDVFSAILPEHVRLLGAEHPTTLTIRGNLAATLTLSGDPAAAALVLEELLALRIKAHGAEHPETLTVRGNLAAARLRAGQFGAAESAFRDYLALCRRLNGDHHPSCAERSAGLGKALREQGRHAEALAAFTVAWQQKQASEGKQFAPAEQVAAEIAELYRRWGRPAEQALWQARAGDRVPAPVIVVQAP